MARGLIGLSLFVVAVLAFVGLEAFLARSGKHREAPMALQLERPREEPHTPPPGISPPIGATASASLFSDPQVPRLILTVILLVPALFVILTSKYQEADKHWAYGTIGTIVGFWLKG